MSAGRRATLLVVAKAPVPGLAKTRLTTALTPTEAAQVAAAALLDTLDAALATPARTRVVALTGELDDAVRSAELRAALARFTVVGQRGDGLGERLAAAHLDAARAGDGDPVLQVGMDTPQLDADLLSGALDALAEPGTDAVLGPAADGGWWALGVRGPELAECLTGVPMSRADTGVLTRAALEAAGARVTALPELRDVDTPDDLAPVAGLVPAGRFAAAVAGLGADRDAAARRQEVLR